jgi:hypothetical protein
LQPILKQLIHHKYLSPGGLSLLLLVTFLLYRPGLAGDFIFDDFINIIDNSAVHLTGLSPSELAQTVSSGVTTFINRPLSMLTFGLNHYLSGLAPYPFKFTNLLLHLAISIGMYLLSRDLLGRSAATKDMPATRVRLLALLITACWALHPLNVSSVLYVVQRMNQLAMLSTLAALYYYCRLRAAGIATQTQALKSLLILAALLVLAILCKENGALLAPLVLLVEYFFFRFQANSSAEKFFLRAYSTLFLLLPGILLLLYTLANPGWILGPYAERSFSLAERLMSEARILWMYVNWIVLPDIRQFTFYHDTFAPSRSLLEPVSTLFSIAGLVAVAILVWRFHKRLPLLAFGVCWYFTGHLLESSVLALELVFEHRNYLPAYGLIFGILGTALTLPAHVFSPKTAGGLALCFLFFLADGTYLLSSRWGSPALLLLEAHEQKPDSYRVNYSLARFYLRYANQAELAYFFDNARDHYIRTDQLDPSAIRGLTGIIFVDTQTQEGLGPELARQMKDRILNARLDENFYTDIAGLTECWLLQHCQFDKSYLAVFYQAIADNRVANTGQKKSVLLRLADTAFVEQSDPVLQSTLRLMAAALN